MSINKVILLGRLGQDPELKYLPNGTALCSFSLATSENWESNGSKQEKTEWHSIVVWGKLAEVCNHNLQKGSQVYLEGSIQSSNWVDKKSGKTKKKFDINAKVIQFIGAKVKDYSEEDKNDFTSDDVPF